MSDMNIEMFKAISSKTRMEMLKLLMHRKYHITGLAQEIGISVPVAAKHVRILEDAGLVVSEEFGRTRVLSINKDRLYEILDVFGEDYEVKVEKGKSVLDVLKEVSGIGVRKIDEKEFIVSINGENGFYIYEVNGDVPDVPVNKYRIERDGELVVKKLVPVLKKKIKVIVSNAENKENAHDLSHRHNS